jgi:hypothetical protein
MVEKVNNLWKARAFKGKQDEKVTTCISSRRE